MTMTPTSPAATSGADRYGYASLGGLIGLQTGDAKHDQAAVSTLDVLWVLWRMRSARPPGTTRTGSSTSGSGSSC